MYRVFFKRILDFLMALILIILTSPLMLITYFLIKKHISKNAIFTQLRPGLNEKIFKIYKFKTMNDERDENGKLLPDELRLNDYGKKIRALSLDELPQLFNVLKGDMSLVGTRPPTVDEYEKYNSTQKRRLSFKP